MNMVEFAGNGPTLIINAAKVQRLEPASAGRTVNPYTAIIMDSGIRHTVAGTPQDVAEALGYQLVAFSPSTGLSEASQVEVE